MENFMKSSIDLVKIRAVEKIGVTVNKIDVENATVIVMQNKNKLRHLKERVYISNERTREKGQIHRKLKRMKEKARGEGKV